MKKLMKGMVLSMALLAPSVHAAPAAMKLAVFDPQAALWNTEAAQKALMQFKSDIKVQTDRMDVLRKQLDQLSENLKANGSVMSKDQRDKIQAKGDQMYKEYQNLAAAVQEKNQKMQQTVIASMKPKLDSAVQSLIKSGGYDLIVDSHAALYVSPDLDITKQVIEKINQGGAAK